MKTKVIKVIIDCEDDYDRPIRINTTNYFYDKHEPIYVIDSIDNLTDSTKFAITVYDRYKAHEDDINKSIEAIANALNDSKVQF